jgi:hypothetical protein
MLMNNISTLINLQLVVVKGCRDLSIKKGQHCFIAGVVLQERGSAKITIHFTNGPRTLYINHTNRFSDDIFHMNNGDPTKRVSFEKV